MAELSIEGPGGSFTLEIDPGGSDSGLNSPPPMEQNFTDGRIIAIHPIPGRTGNRKQDMGKDDAVLTLIGICLGDIAAVIQGLPGTPNSGEAYSITYTPDAGPGVDYPDMWLQRCSVGVRKGSVLWHTFSMTFIEKNQTED